MRKPMTSEEILARAFDEKRPCVLWLGQDTWAPLGRPDPVLALFLTRLGRQPSPDAGWKNVLERVLRRSRQPNQGTLAGPLE
jgi:hypothetical protein